MNNLSNATTGMNIKNILVKNHPGQGRLETGAKLLKTSEVGNTRPSKSMGTLLDLH